MSNHASRRARKPPPKLRAPRVIPNGARGVEVDSDENGNIVLSCFSGELVSTVKWNPNDARKIARMINDAVDRAGTAAENIIEEERGSGLVVARTLPPS